MGEASKRSSILRAMQRLIRPICRLALRNAIKLSDLLEVVKVTLIEVATEDLERKSQKVSASRISAMTGVHRKDVTRITLGKELPESPNLISRVMVQWRHDKAFCTKDNNPKTLSVEGKDSEFSKLVHSTNGADINPYTILFEMERIGAVERKDGNVKLLWSHFVPPASIENGLNMLAEDSEDLASAVEQNVFDSPEIKNLHLKTEFDGIAPQFLPEIKNWLITEGSRFHDKVSEYLSHFDCDLNPDIKGEGGKARVAFGAFSFTSTETKKRGN